MAEAAVTPEAAATVVSPVEASVEAARPAASVVAVMPLADLPPVGTPEDTRQDAATPLLAMDADITAGAASP
jgi:hypothetical protein